jgi:hypothetical protein
MPMPSAKCQGAATRHTQHAEKNRGRRVLFPLKRANTAAFGLCGRAAGQLVERSVVVEGRRGGRRALAPREPASDLGSRVWLCYVVCSAHKTDQMHQEGRGSKALPLQATVASVFINTQVAGG